MCDTLWVLVATLARDWFGSSDGRMLWLSRASGVLVVALGVLVAMEL